MKKHEYSNAIRTNTERNKNHIYAERNSPSRFILEVPRARAPSKNDFIPVICWGADAAAIRDFTTLNSRVEIRGEIQTFHRDKDDTWDINVVADWVSLPDRVERKIEATKEAKNGR